LAAALREFVQIEPRMPATAKAQSVFLPIVAVIPDEVTGPTLLIQQAV
jgi:hypothetical protein